MRDCWGSPSHTCLCDRLQQLSTWRKGVFSDRMGRGPSVVGHFTSEQNGCSQPNTAVAFRGGVYPLSPADKCEYSNNIFEPRACVRGEVGKGARQGS